jgi:hypothetical protein
MNRQLTAAVAGVPVVVLFAALAVAQGPVAQKPDPKAAPGKSTVSRTPDGKPDLSGVYSNATTVPVQRAQNLGAKEFYTQEEYDAIQNRQRNAKDVGLHYDNGQFGLTQGQTKTAVNLRTSIITGPEGRVPAVLPEVAKAQAERRAYNQAHQWDDAQSRPLAERCITWGFEGPPMMPVGYNSDLQIVQGPGYVSFIQEMIHDTRMIPTDGRPHLPANVRQFMGDPRGHWEGDTLVVETTNFNGALAIQGAPTSTDLKVTERFTKTDGDTVLYQFTVNDPKTWTKPFSGELTMTRIDSPLYEYACHEGNYGMTNNITGQRTLERRAAEQKKQ